MFKKVLVPVSGQSQCRRAQKSLDKALDLCDGEIVLLHVTDPIPQTVGGDAREELRAHNEAEGMALMRPVIDRLEQAGVSFHTRVESGIPSEIIVKIADEEKADLIIMFTDGRDGLGDMLLGSITERVLRDTETDLLAIRR